MTAQAVTSTFDPSKVQVIFILGGPGAGKGTQCARLVRDFDFVHLSAGDLLREERNRPGSEVGELINRHIREGTIVPMQITISLLETAMKAAAPHTRFLIDGFPRNIEQGLAFEEQVCPAQATFFFDCTEELLIKRLLERGRTSGRDDDNIESIRKRLVTYRDTTMPVINYYDSKGLVYKFDTTKPVEAVHADISAVLKKI